MDFQIDQAAEVLERTPSTLRAMLSGVSEPWVRNNYGEKTFSPFDVVGHLIHGERTDWIPRARIILEHGEARPFEPFDRYAMYEDSRGRTMAELLSTFESLRRQNLGALRAMGLGPKQLGARGTHPELGAVTLRDLLAAWVCHDLNHIAQISKAMAHQYRDQVGSWRAYMSILPR